jgi:hypothetical protein
MRKLRMSNTYSKLRGLAVVLASMVVASAVLADQMVTNAAGVLAGITGIIYRQSDNSIAVQFAVRDPTGTNATTFAIEESTDGTNWANLSTITVTGNFPVAGVGSAEISDFATSTTQFYRMRLINF